MTPFHGTAIQMTVTLKPEDVPTFWDAFKPVFEHVTAEQECTFFEVYKSEDPGVISWTENWSKSKEWIIDVQIKKPYYDDYRKITTPLLLKPVEVRVYERLGPEFTVVKRENGGLKE
ncbi:hypothetical protein BDW69DRAFT_182106 [Aspergillus filifer]